MSGQLDVFWHSSYKKDNLFLKEKTNINSFKPFASWLDTQPKRHGPISLLSPEKKQENSFKNTVSSEKTQSNNSFKNCLVRKAVWIFSREFFVGTLYKELIYLRL